jgi:mRNA-degrading endonuclease toxin of MazEF toxin-antitoxin module
MSVLSDAFKKIGIGKIKIEAGGIYRLRDDIIKIPDSDLLGNRTKHDFRTVVVLSNQQTCDSFSSPVVIVAPLSHELEPRPATDLIVYKTAENKLAHDSRYMFGYIQPVLKSDLDKQIGRISEEDWQRVMGKIVWNFDR